MASVASQLIEEVTTHAQSLEDALEICADGIYFSNNLCISETAIRINMPHVTLWDVSVETNKPFDCIIENSGFIYIHIYICVCVCVCIYFRIIYININTYMYIYCVCVCVYDSDVNLRHSSCQTHSKHSFQTVIPPRAVLFNKDICFNNSIPFFTVNMFKFLVTVNFVLLLLLLLLLLSSSSSSSSSSSPLCRVFTHIFLRQTMSLGNTV